MEKWRPLFFLGVGEWRGAGPSRWGCGARRSQLRYRENCGNLPICKLNLIFGISPHNLTDDGAILSKVEEAKQKIWGGRSRESHGGAMVRWRMRWMCRGPAGTGLGGMRSTIGLWGGILGDGGFHDFRGVGHAWNRKQARDVRHPTDDTTTRC